MDEQRNRKIVFAVSVMLFKFSCYRPRTYVRREVMFSQVCVCSGGGVPGLRFSGGVPGLRFVGGGPRSQIFLGGVPGLRFLGGSQVSDFQGGGYLVSVKGKIFDTRFGLIHVQTGKKIFVEGPSPPPVKGKIFDTRFGLIHVQTGKIFFLSRDPPPGIARNCYGYAAGGMPLAFTQEDFLV